MAGIRTRTGRTTRGIKFGLRHELACPPVSDRVPWEGVISECHDLPCPLVSPESPRRQARDKQDCGIVSGHVPSPTFSRTYWPWSISLKARGTTYSSPRSAAAVVREGVAETLSYYAYPAQHWRRIRTNNPMERIIREILRRTWVVGSFPDGESALMLVAARLRHIAGRMAPRHLSQLSDWRTHGRVLSDQQELAAGQAITRFLEPGVTEDLCPRDGAGDRGPRNGSRLRSRNSAS